MTENQLPPKFACWLLRHLGSQNSETMLGDMNEQFVNGKSRSWFWQEVGVAIAISTYSAARLNRSSIMKRAIVSTIVLLGVFALGYWTARSTLVVHEEMPGPGVGAEILIKDKGASYLVGMHSAVLPIREMTQGLLAVPGVKAVAPIVTGMDSGFTVVYGIDPQSFNAVSGGFKIVQGRMFEKPNEALIDEWQQSEMKVKVGDRVEFLKMDFTISGVVEQGKGARIFIPLQTFQEKLKREGLAALFYVKLNSGVTTKQTIDRIRAAFADDTKEILDLNELASLMSSN
jgi:hypothetical protein